MAVKKDWSLALTCERCLVSILNIFLINYLDYTKTLIPLALMASEPIRPSASWTIDSGIIIVPTFLQFYPHVESERAPVYFLSILIQEAKQYRICFCDKFVPVDLL